MISERFRALVAALPAEVEVAGVLHWHIGLEENGLRNSTSQLADLKAPLLKRLTLDDRIDVVDLPALPCAVLRASAAHWREMLARGTPDLEASTVTLEANEEVPLIEPICDSSRKI